MKLGGKEMYKMVLGFLSTIFYGFAYVLLIIKIYSYAGVAFLIGLIIAIIYNILVLPDDIREEELTEEDIQEIEEMLDELLWSLSVIFWEFRFIWLSKSDEEKYVTEEEGIQKGLVYGTDTILI